MSPERRQQTLALGRPSPGHSHRYAAPVVFAGEHPSSRHWTARALILVLAWLPPALWAADPDVDAATAPASPQPVEDFTARAMGKYQVELSWAPASSDAVGIVVQRCWPNGNNLGCELAAALHADVRSLVHHSIQPWRFRVAAFNGAGVSAYTPLSDVLGTDHWIETGEPPVLQASDSIVARGTVERMEPGRVCTSPQALIDSGLELVAVRASEDLYRGPAGECGNGGCPYISYTANADCYEVLEADQLLHRAPYVGRAHYAGSGVRLSGSSSSACEGTVVVFAGDAEADSYDWYSCYDETLLELIQPFNPEDRQWPDNPRPVGSCLQTHSEIQFETLQVDTCLVASTDPVGSVPLARSITQTLSNLSDRIIELQLHADPVDQFQINIYVDRRMVNREMAVPVPDSPDYPQYDVYFRRLEPGAVMQLGYLIADMLIEPIDADQRYTFAINSQFYFRFLEEPRGQAVQLRSEEARLRNPWHKPGWFYDVRLQCTDCSP